jgi:hypothetical protein
VVSLNTAGRDGNRDGGTEAGTGTVMTAIHHSGINRCQVRNGESATRGVLLITS